VTPYCGDTALVTTITQPATSAAKKAFTFNAAVAWLGVGLTALFSGLGWYQELPVEPGLYGGHPDGAPGALFRLVDTFSYFTIWSNLVVCISTTLLAQSPNMVTFGRQVLRLAALVMITVTAIVYQVLLAPSAVITGWSRLTDPMLHIATPLVTIVVWLWWGPRGWVNLRVFVTSMALPVIWIFWMLMRGGLVGKYPYGFLNIAEFGISSVFQTLGFILGFGVFVAALYWMLDQLLTYGALHRGIRQRAASPEEDSIA
jgi:uncharacterized membrane protein YciS (DUF1049 family)